MSLKLWAFVPFDFVVFFSSCNTWRLTWFPYVACTISQQHLVYTSFCSLGQTSLVLIRICCFNCSSNSVVVVYSPAYGVRLRANVFSSVIDIYIYSNFYLTSASVLGYIRKISAKELRNRAKRIYGNAIKQRHNLNHLTWFREHQTL